MTRAEWLAVKSYPDLGFSITLGARPGMPTTIVGIDSHPVIEFADLEALMSTDLAKHGVAAVVA
jgi:hypothetical protein